MSDRPPIPLTPSVVTLGSDAFELMAGWRFADPFVVRLLRSDIPRRVQFNECRVWLYLDPVGTPVGFGTLDVCEDYIAATGGRPHPYIPLLAVNPTIKSRGYGTSIVRHLISEAALRSCRPGCCDDLFLDVYTTSVKAIEVYTDAGFKQVGSPRSDLDDGGRPYLVMARRVLAALVPASGS